MNDKQPLESMTVMQRVREGENEIDLLMLASYFLEHIKLIIICFFAGALVFGSVSVFLISPSYQATAKMYIVSASNDSIVDLTDLNIGTSLTADYEELIMSDPVAEQVIENLKLDTPVEELLKMIAISNPQDTRVLYITATAGDPKLSRDLANEFMDVSLEYLPDTMSTNPPNVAQRAKTPETKSSPSNSKNTMIGALLGLLLACGWLTVQYLRDDTIHSAEDMESYFGIVPLTVIPDGGNIDDPADKNGSRKGKKKKFGRKGGAN